MSLDHLSARLGDTLVLPGSAAFEDARRHHGQPGDPAAVVRAACVEDVQVAIAAARREGLPVAVRSGGHGAWETVPGALVIDLRALRTIELDATTAEDGTRVVHVGAGATWGEVAAELGAAGLAVSSGDTRSVGVGGLTLGGGIGWVVRCWGLALDQLVGAQLVTADGRVLEVSEAAEPDLFWAVRGGGGNFGVATRLDFVAHPLAGVVHASLTLDGTDLAEAIRGFRDAMRAAPRELNGSLVRTPGMGPDVPPRTVLELAFAGTDEVAAQSALAPLLALPRVVSAEVAPARYLDLLQEPPMPPPGFVMPTVVDANGWFAALDDDVVDDLVAAFHTANAQMLLVRWLGGAFSEVDPHATAIAFREAEAFIVTAAFVPPGATDADAERMASALSPFAAHSLGMYGNFTNSVASGLAARMYPPDTLARLRALKRAWDPENVFRRNHNLDPAPA